MTMLAPHLAPLPNNDSFGGLAPHSLEAEEALLGSILIHGGDLIKDLAWLKPETFFILRNQLVYKAMLILHNRQEQIDNLTLVAELRETQQLEIVGGSSYITQLINHTPTYIHYYSYAEIVRECARRRQVLELATRIGQGALAGDAEAVQRAIQDTKAVLEEKDTERDEMRRYSVHVRDLKHLSQVQWLISGEIPVGGITMLFGPSGIGKSFVALDYAMSLAKERPVVYIAAEGQSGYYIRTAAWSKHHKVDVDSLKLMFFLKMLSLLDPRENEAFIELYKPLQPALVIVDTLSLSMLPGDENSARDIAQFIKAAQKIQTGLQCALLFVHHTGKEGKDYRGSSALRANCDVMIRLSGDDDVITVECTKSKDSAAFPRRYVKMLPVECEDGSSQVVVPADLIKQTVDDPVTAGQRKVLEALALDTLADGAATNDLVDVTEMGRGSIIKMLGTLIKLGYVQKLSGAAPYQITRSGRVALDPDSSDSMTPSDSNTDSKHESRQRADDSSDSKDSTRKFDFWNDGVSGVDGVMESASRTANQLGVGVGVAQSNQLTLIKTSAPTPPYPEHPCPVCGSSDWNRSRITGGWYCYSCAETKRRALLPPTSE